MIKTIEQVQNCLHSDLRNMLYELEAGDINKEMILGFFSEILLDANVDSRIIVHVLEHKGFGQEGKDAARYIKVDEGW